MNYFKMDWLPKDIQNKDRAVKYKATGFTITPMALMIIELAMTAEAL